MGSSPAKKGPAATLTGNPAPGYELSLEVHDAGGTTMGLYWICATALFEPGTEQGMVRQWRCLLDAAMAQQDTPAAALQLLDAAQRQAVLAVARRPVRADWEPEDEASSIHRQVQARALRSLEAVEVSESKRQRRFAESAATS